MRGGVRVSLREILFRGKRVDSGAWSYGSLVIRKKDDGGRKYFISGFEPFSKAGEVLGETVGEYTGFRDTSGNAVFEGDVVIDHRGAQGVVAWDNECSRYMVYSHWKGEKYVGYVGRDKPHTVISTIHDQPFSTVELATSGSDNQ